MQDKYKRTRTTLQNFAEFSPTPFSHSMPTGWAKNGTVLFNCLNVVALLGLLLLTSVSRHLYIVLSTFFINKNVEKIYITLKT